MHIYSYLLVLILFSVPAFSRGPKLHFESKLEELIFLDYKNNSEEDIIKNWLVAEGVHDSTEIETFKKEISDLIIEISKEYDVDDDLDDRAEYIYDFLYKNVFRTFKQNARFQNIVKNKIYNEFNAGLLYYLICKDFEIQFEITEVVDIFLFRVIDNQEKLHILFNPRGDGFDSDFDVSDLRKILRSAFARSDAEIAVYVNSFSDTKILTGKSITAWIYNNRGFEYFLKGLLETALYSLEKGLILNPENKKNIQNYKSVLYNLSDITSNYRDFIPHLKNAIWFLGDDPEFSLPGQNMIAKALNYYVVEQKAYYKASEFISDTRVLINDKRILVFLDQFEQEMQADWIQTLQMRGKYKYAYVRARDYYFEHNETPRYKDIYINTAMNYVSRITWKQDKRKEAESIVDSLIMVAPDYPVVEELYIQTKVISIMRNRNLPSQKTAKLASLKELYKKFPENEIIRLNISSIYHQMAMDQVRKNKLKKAYRILDEGLKFDPGSKLLDSAQESILKQYE